MKKRNQNRAWLFRGMTGTFAALLILTGSIRTIAFDWKDKVDELLGVSSNGVERSRDADDYIYPSDYETAKELVAAEIGLATRIQAEGTVLLKGTAKTGGMNITLFGIRSEKMQYGGTMGGRVSDKQCVNLSDALEESGFHVNPVMRQFYKDMSKTYSPGKAAGASNVDQNAGAAVNEIPIKEYTQIQEDSYAEYRDAAIIVLGRDSSEGSDYYPGEEGIAHGEEFSESITGNILGLSDEERNLVSYVKEKNFKKIIVLINSGCAMELEELDADEKVDTIMWIGNPGCYGTYGVARILNGELLPSGHLADTYAVNSALSPAAVNYGAYIFENAADIDMSPNDALRSNWYLAETEGIYIGYKYYETRYYDSVAEQGNASLALHGETADGKGVWNYDNEVTYSFGYGIEGSKFTEEIVESSIDWTGETDSMVTVRVTNTGDSDAKHVIQLYVAQPYTNYDRENGIEKSAVQLVGYAKTGEALERDYTDVVLLAPGKSEDVTITFNTSDFRTYDKTYVHDHVSGAFILEAGEYLFVTGNGAHDAVERVLKYQYPERMQEVTPTGALQTEKLEEDLAFTKSNGTLIQNRLQNAELNTWNCGTEIVYLTRNNWAETFPAEVASIKATDEMMMLLRNATYNSDVENRDYIGETEWEYEQELGVVAASLAGADYDDPRYEELMQEVSLQDMLDQYTANTETLKSIGLPKVNGADSPLGIMGFLGRFASGTIYELAESDEYYGYETNVYESEVVVASTFSHILASEQGRIIGNDSIWTFVTQWNAPGLNIHRTPYNGRNYEYYSEDPVLTGNMGADLVGKAQEYGVSATAKHFAFNDQETNRDGVAVFLNEQAARENELRGFQIVIEDGGLMNLMSAFNRIGLTHCGASRELMNGILRGEWGYKGRVITDSVKSAQYFLPNECLMAGNDQMLGGGNSSAAWGYSVEVFKKDPALQAQLRESYRRYLYTAINSNRMNGITEESSVDNPYTAWQWWLTAIWVLCIGMTVVSAGMWIWNTRRKGYD